MPTKPIVVSVTVLVLATAGTAAQTQQGTSVGPGFIGPASPLYGLEVAFDDATTAIGLTTAATVAQERVAEARVMVRQDNDAGLSRALAQLNNTIAAVPPSQAVGLETARAELDALVASTPDAADRGLTTALDHVTKAAARADARQEIQRLRQRGTEDAQQRAMELQKRLESMRTPRDAEQLQDEIAEARDDFKPKTPAESPKNGGSNGVGLPPMAGH